MQLTIRHTLTFSLGTPARAVQHLLLTPLATPQQKIERWSIEMPGIADAAVFRDGFGNRAHLVSQIKPEPRIVVTAGGVVETLDRAGVLGRLDLDPMPAMFRRQTLETTFDPALIEGLAGGGDRIAMLHELMGRLHATRLAPTRMQAQGSQQQAQGGEMAPRGLALAFVGAARELGVPARYVTGYLLDEDGKASFHAWAEAWDEGLGWIGFDAKLDMCPTGNHIRLASGLDATGTMPIRSAPVWNEMPVETVEIEAA
jgi:transglutaminase-like putative cysteine protease